MEFRDLTKTPPTRAFLEAHVDATDFLSFVSRRSPIFRTQALPTSKKEAVDLMMAQPNLIKRPILIRGKDVVFGFDKQAYASPR